jgi:hypothetical protein
MVNTSINSSPKALSGGCHCGRVRYTLQAENRDAYYCHCRMCQLSFGNIFATFHHCKKINVTWTAAEPKYFGSSHFAKRGFCPDCGTPLTFEYLDSANMDISVGSLDHPEVMKPVSHFAVESRIAAFHTEDGLAQQHLVDHKKLQQRWEKHYGVEQKQGPLEASQRPQT